MKICIAVEYLVVSWHCRTNIQNSEQINVLLRTGRNQQCCLYIIDLEENPGYSRKYNTFNLVFKLNLQF